MTHTTRTLSAAAILALVFCARIAAADLWVAATSPAVVTNNDCGQIVALAGKPLIHRSFQTGATDGIPASIADRISSGDELIAPDASRIEWITGANTVAVLGAGGRVRFDGLRVFTGADGKETSRLDVTLLSGELRVQVRLNENKPESVLAALGGADFLVTRGDVELFAADGWRGAVLSGQASGRLQRGSVPGAPFAVEEGSIVAATGESRMDAGETDAVKSRVPFSFESARAALPPGPAMSAEMDAP
jgi:hypothetical protein